jgi:hypothetical protein
MTSAHPAQTAGSPASARAFGLRDLGITFEPLGTQEVGFGAVTWLRLGPSAPGLLTLARPRHEGPSPSSPASPATLQIGETGQVPELQVENRGRVPLLLPAHVVLSGGWQTRAVERSVVVPGGGSVRVPVKCVEAGRWAPRDEQTARTFEVIDRAGVRTRWSTTQSMAAELARHGRFAAEQATVWQQIDEELTRSAVTSRTRSYEAYLQGVKRRLVAEAQRAAVRPPLAANGAVIFPRGGGFWIEAFPTPEALAEHADDLLSDLFDPTGGEGELNHENVDRILEALASAPLRRLEGIAGSVGDAYAFTASPRPAEAPREGSAVASRPKPRSGAEPVDGDVLASAAGALLVVDGGLAHISVGAAPRRREETGISGSRSREEIASAVAAALATGEGMVAAGVAQGSDGANERPRVDLETMRGIYGRARDLVPEGPPARERVQGYRLVRVLDRNISWVDIRIGGDGYAVLGSHDRCDLVLSSDAGVWLRHLAAICVRLEDGGVGLRLIDLKTDLPFFLDDDTARWSVLARGPFAMRLGRHVVCGFPIGPATEGAAASSPRSEAVRAVPDRGRPRNLGETGVLETGISFDLPPEARPLTAVPVLNELSSFVPSAPVSQIQDLLGPSTSPNHVRVTLERGGMGASVELPSEALEAGVLLGRALNCFDGGLRRIFCEAISRAHVLLVRDRDDVFAFDLCSTNGTRVAGQRIRRYRLSDSGATLELGKKVVFRWHRREG